MKTDISQETKVVLRTLLLVGFLNFSYYHTKVGIAAVHALVPQSTFTSLVQRQCAKSVCPIHHNLDTTALSSTPGDAHPEMAFERESAGGTVSTSSMPTRKKKHQNRKKRTKQQRHPRHMPPLSGPLDEHEVAHHVASQYVNGKRGITRVTNARMEKVESSACKDHLDYMKKLNRHPALVLNADYQPLSCLPLSLWSWQEAMKAVFSGKVTVVDVYPDIYVRSSTLSTPLPAVIALNEYAPQRQQRPAFTRRNVFLRDQYRCQYCSKCFRTGDLSLDHVHPRCMGGKLEWENTVTCCKKCNGRKGSLTVSQLRTVGMKLIRDPVVPSSYELAAVAGKMMPRRVHPTWAPYLGVSDEQTDGSVKEEGEILGLDTIFDDL